MSSAPSSTSKNNTSDININTPDYNRYEFHNSEEVAMKSNIYELPDNSFKYTSSNNPKSPRVINNSNNNEINSDNFPPITKTTNDCGLFIPIKSKDDSLSETEIIDNKSKYHFIKQNNSNDNKSKRRTKSEGASMRNNSNNDKQDDLRLLQLRYDSINPNPDFHHEF